ncbi:unnamed protein product, partial [Prorocentrum cordatum]
MNQYGLEQVIHVLSNDNLELSCGLIEQEVVERACRDIEEAIAPAVQSRKEHKARSPMQPYVDPAHWGQTGGWLPEPLRPPAQQQQKMQVYYDFGSIHSTINKALLPWSGMAAQQSGGGGNGSAAAAGGVLAPQEPPPLCPFRQQAPPAAPEGAGSGLAANSAASALASALGVGTGGAAAGPAQQRWPEGQPQHSQHQPPPQSQQAQPPQQPQQPAKQPQPQQQAPRPRQPSAAPAARNQPATAQPETQAALSQLTAQADRAAHSLLADPPLLPPVDAASPDAYVPDGALDAGAALGLLPLDHPVPTLLRQLPERLAQLPQAGAAALHLARFAFQRLCGARMCPTRSQPPCAASLQHLR